LYQLDTGAVHIWVAVLQDFYPMLADLESVLSADEKDRAGRFRQTEHACDFVVARGLLRRFLACYLCVPATEICFDYSESGKPALAKKSDTNNIEFNLSHSGKLAVFGITKSVEIGVDVERIDRSVDVPLLSRRILSDSEQRHLAQVPDDERVAAFFRYWTHKEAYLKATGEGIGADLAAISLELPEAGLDVRLVDRRGKNKSCWNLQTLILEQGYVGAVAVNAGTLSYQIRRATTHQF
jgi:4'-phosphopantetheinyl transferase